MRILKNLFVAFLGALILFLVLGAWANGKKAQREAALAAYKEEAARTSSSGTNASTPAPGAATSAPAPGGAVAGSPASTSLPTSTPDPTAWASLTKIDPNELIKTYRDSLVFVTSSDGAGSGFIADMGGRVFFLTNAHVAAGVRGAAFTTLQGTAVKIGPASVAVGHDIFAMETTATGNPMPVMRDVDNNAKIGDSVLVLGNAEGGGVINNLQGRIVGFGPNLVEITAPFQPGNSGSPIIHVKTGKVIGVATYLTIRKYDPATKQAISDPVIRRFGYRIDSVKTWQPVNQAFFQAQAKEMESVEKLTEDFVLFIRDIAEDGRVVAGKHTNPAIRSRIDAWMASKTRQMSLKDRAAAEQNFLAFLKVATVSDVQNARQHMTYDFFQRQLADQERERAEIAEVFTKIIQSVQSYR